MKEPKGSSASSAPSSGRLKHKSSKSKPQLQTVKLGSTPVSSQSNSQGSGQSHSYPSKRFKLGETSATPIVIDGDGLSDGNVPRKKKKDAKGKGKAKTDTEEDRLWVDMYEPKTEEDLAVHKKKVDDVRRWLVEALDGGPSGKLRKYRRILVLTGPAGTGKTATIRVLARELGVDVLEWRNAVGERFADFDPDGPPTMEYEAAADKFESFLARASACNTLFTSSTKKRHIILLEDLPNVLHQPTQARVHVALRAFVASGEVPLVLVVSDAGVRGEDADENAARSRGKDIVDMRTLVPKDLLGSPYLTQAGFNPIAPTLLRRALQTLLSTHFPSSKSNPVSKDILDGVVSTANGDIRSAIMALQFACSSAAKGKGKRKERALLEGVTRREQSLALFHLIGKVLYNKRKGDPPTASASAKDVEREREADRVLKDPQTLPDWLAHEQRRASRVDVDMLYADSPIDASLLGLYIHQNYTQFCETMEETEGVSEWLSWVDASGGEAWYQANPHRFHLLTLGTLHGLPSPVPRKNQKMLKPAFFEHLTKQHEAADAMRDVDAWLGAEGRRWEQGQIASELGGVLRARDASMQEPSGSSARAPHTHRLFSALQWTVGGGAGVPLDEDGGEELAEGLGEEDVLDSSNRFGTHKQDHEPWTCGWLEGDDIEEF